MLNDVGTDDDIKPTNSTTYVILGCVLEYIAPAVLSEHLACQSQSEVAGVDACYGNPKTPMNHATQRSITSSNLVVAPTFVERTQSATMS